MKRKPLGVLIAINVALLLALAWICITPGPVQAQRRRGGDYMMLSGKMKGQDREAVYLFELNTSRMLVLGFNTSNNELEVYDGRVVLGDLPELRNNR